MVRILFTIAASSALYGFAIGSVHSRLFACYNLLKFPLLLLTTALTCSLAYYLFARWLTAQLSFRDVQQLVLRMFRDLAVLLASLSPVSYFLAQTIKKPDLQQLHEYPFFLGFNVFFIALCGSFALFRQARVLLERYGLSRSSRLWIMGIWMTLSLVVGGQWAWYLRPFFGVSSISSKVTAFCLGAAPDFRGATNFYEAVYHVLQPPTLPKKYYQKASWGGKWKRIHN